MSVFRAGGCCCGSCTGCVTACPSGTSCDPPELEDDGCHCTAAPEHACVRDYTYSFTITNHAKKCFAEPQFYPNPEFLGCLCADYDDSAPVDLTLDRAEEPGFGDCPADIEVGESVFQTWDIEGTVPAATDENEHGRVTICPDFDSGIVGSTVRHRMRIGPCGSIIVEVWDIGTFFLSGSCIGPTLHCMALYNKRAGTGTCVVDGIYDLDEASVEFSRCHAYVVSEDGIFGVGHWYKYCALPAGAYTCGGEYMSEVVTGDLTDAEAFGWGIPTSITIS